MNTFPANNSAAFTPQQIIDCCRQNDTELLTPTTADLLEKSSSGVFTDSRRIANNSIFIALKGEKFDGHQFIAQAAKAGAALIVVEQDIPLNQRPENVLIIKVKSTLQALGELARCHRERFSLPVVAITGSYGKTTTRAFVTAALESSLDVLSTQENFNNEIGVPQTLLQLDFDYQAAVVEMGMRGKGQIGYLANIAKPTVAIITNIGPQHIELLGSLQNIADAKAELLRALPENGIAILPADSEFFPYLCEQTKAEIWSFGVSENAQYRVVESTFNEYGDNVCRINTPQRGIRKTQVPLPGIHNAVNAAAALAAADACGVNINRAAVALRHSEVPGDRLKIRRNPLFKIINDCYNSGPFSASAALDVLEQYPDAPRRVAILGSMLELGESSVAEHRAIGNKAGEIAELIIGVGDETKVLLEAAQESGNCETHWFENAQEAVAQINNYVQSGDVILVKGSRGIGLEVVVKTLDDIGWDE